MKVAAFVVSPVRSTVRLAEEPSATETVVPVKRISSVVSVIVTVALPSLAV